MRNSQPKTIDRRYIDSRRIITAGLKHTSKYTFHWHNIELHISPTTFSPRYSISSCLFAEYVADLDLSGKTVLDVGTGSGILVFAALEAGAKNVMGTDINSQALQDAKSNLQKKARKNVQFVKADIFPDSESKFDVILANLPLLDGDPESIAWSAVYDPGLKSHINLLFNGKRHLNPDGHLIYLISDVGELRKLKTLIRETNLKIAKVDKLQFSTSSWFVYHLRNHNA